MAARWERVGDRGTRDHGPQERAARVGDRTGTAGRGDAGASVRGPIPLRDGRAQRGPVDVGAVEPTLELATILATARTENPEIKAAEARYEAALQRLKPGDREAIIARVEMGLPYSEVAAALGKPSVAAAHMAVSRALVRLAEEMARSHRTAVRSDGAAVHRP